jgi:hypothetical protein
MAEAMALYIDSYDPAMAKHYLSKLQYMAGQLVGDDYVNGILERISPRVESAYRTYEKHADRLSSSLNQPYRETPFENISINEIDKILNRFPGVWNLWWMRHCYCFRNNQASDAQAALQNARILSPSNEQLSASLMMFVSHVEPRALSTLEICRSELKRFINSALINTTFAVSVLHAQRGQIRKSVLREIVDAVIRARDLGATDFEDTITMIAGLFSYGRNSEQMSSAEKTNALLKLVGISENIIPIDDFLAMDSANDVADVTISKPDQLMSWMFSKIQPSISHSLRAAV